MKKAIDYVLSVLYLLHFGLTLAVFHVYQVIAFNVFGWKAHKRSVDHLNFSLNFGLLLTGARIKYTEEVSIPTDRPLIIIANHQSTFDIPGIIWFLRKHRPVFVSKKELAKGIPSISYNLIKSGAALIDRKDSRQALMEIARLGKLIETNTWSAVIFPEGTRTPSGKMKPFAVGGVAALLKKAPSAHILPVAIDGTGRLNPGKGIFPLTAFTKLSWNALAPIDPAEYKTEELVALVQERIQIKLDEIAAHRK